VTKAILSRALGISAARTLPSFARRPFAAPSIPAPSVPAPAEGSGARVSRRAAPHPDLGRPSVLLFADTYNTYSYPQVAQAACTVLHAAGLRVQVAPLTDCGRPALSKGMIERARRQAQRVLAVLEPQARMGVPILFLEPSDWSAVVDDYAALVPGDRRQAVLHV
jgi:Fe-S oxidoreductase